MINVALLKGRLGERAYEAFASAEHDCPAILEEDRRLTFENRERGMRYFRVKPSDVSIHVERGAVDAGVVGRDILLEYEPDVYKLLDLGIDRCCMCMAGSENLYDVPGRALRVATKFPHITAEYYTTRFRGIGIIRLSGSVELVPILSLSGMIMDTVEADKALLEDHLAPLETVVGISAWLTNNWVGHQFEHQEVTAMQATLAQKL